MKHEDFLEKLNNLKDEADSAKEDYIECLLEQKKAKKIWAILKRQIKDLREHYNTNKTSS